MVQQERGVILFVELYAPAVKISRVGKKFLLSTYDAGATGGFRPQMIVSDAQYLVDLIHSFKYYVVKRDEDCSVCGMYFKVFRVDDMN